MNKFFTEVGKKTLIAAGGYLLFRGVEAGIDWGIDKIKELRQNKKMSSCVDVEKNVVNDIKKAA